MDAQQKRARCQSLILEAHKRQPADVGLPGTLIGPLCRYVVYGSRPGGFLYVVLAHDLFGACEAADKTSLDCLPVLVAFIRAKLPVRCHGSASRVEAWMLDMNRK